MKKLWIGLGIGCGALILLGVVGIGVTGYFVKKKAESFVGGMQKTAAVQKQQEAKLAALDAKYPFKSPPDGKPLALTDDRLQAYLAVRENALPVYKEFEAKSKSLNAQYKNAGQVRGIQGGIEAMGMLSDFMAKVRDAYVEGLEKQHMSPREFGAITGAIYASAMGHTSEERKALQDNIAKLKQQAEHATAEQKSMFEQQEKMLQDTLDSLPKVVDEDVLKANAALVEKYQERIKTAANPAFDVFAGTLAGNEVSKQLDAATGHPQDEGAGEGDEK